jgi:hypothetical protein
MIAIRLLAMTQLLSLAMSSSIAAASESEPAFNHYMVQAYENMKNDVQRSNKGYSMASFFTKNLDYGKDFGAVKARNAPYTMCNAAVTETFIEAMNLYAKDHPNWSPNDAIPISYWNSSDWRSLRPHLFSHSYFDYPPLEGIPLSEIPDGLKKDIRDFQSDDGMYQAFEKFGLGYRIEFKDAQPGDVITLDRALTNKEGKERSSGHSVIFLGFVNRNQELQEAYEADSVVGFKYFSSQGTLSDGGLGERWAYFKGKMCPFVFGYQVPDDPKHGGCADAVDSAENRSKNPALIPDQKRDCCIKRDGRDGLRVARLLSPSLWSFKTAQALMADKYVQLQHAIADFIQNRRKSSVRIGLIAKGTSLLEAKQPDVAQDFATRVDRKFNIDLRTISATGAAPEISPRVVNEITKIAPDVVIEEANRTVTDADKSRMNADVKQSGADAIEKLTDVSRRGGVPNNRLDGKSLD